MPGLLTKLKIRAFALVDKGACYDPESGEGSHILLAKHAEPREIGKRTFEEIRQGRDMMVAVHDMYEMFGDFSTAVSSALYDDDVEDREGEIRASMEQFTAAVDEALPAWLEGRTTTEKVGRKISAARLARLRSSRDVLEEIIREAEGGSKVADTKDTKKAETPTVEELQAQLAASEAKLTEAEGKLAKQAAPKDEEKVDPLKDLPEPVRKHVDERITAAEGKATAAEQESVKLAGRIAELEKADKRREFRKIAETDLATWPGTVDEKIEKIEKLHEKLGREDAEKQIKEMAAVAKLSGASPLFKVLGGDGTGAAGGSIETIRKRVDEACAKDVKLTRADAYTKVLKEDPELHKQYNEERGAAKMLEGQQLLWSGTFKAAADMINDQYRFCKLDGSDEVVRCDVAGEPGFVNVDKPRAGQGASFVVQGVTKVIAGAALPPFARVTTDNQGRAVLAAEADVINGVTLDRVAAAGELVTILVYGHAVEFTAVT